MLRSGFCTTALLRLATPRASRPRTMATRTERASTLTELAAHHSDPTFIRQLHADPESLSGPNDKMRSVKSGHFVMLKPKPLPNPQLVIASEEMAMELGISKAELSSDAFLRFFSGDSNAVPGFGSSWATPYALSIYGQEMISNCPFGDGTGYGDGRAISVAEVCPGGARWELQLKGGGTTPWCRGGDGRAVLRSSIREYLASEFMAAAGIPTTRALSTIVSKSEKAVRKWYHHADGDLPTIEDPRLADFPIEMRKALIAQLAGAETASEEPVAITCRAATSFIRVGHFELYARRTRGGGPSAQLAREELEMLARYTLNREYADGDAPSDPLSARLVRLLTVFRSRLTALTSQWMNLGFVQGNFNSDNCLVGGRTMDYGPFGFMAAYDRGWGCWIGAGDHFSYGNQMNAGRENYKSLVSALRPLLDESAQVAVNSLVDSYDAAARSALDDMWRKKLGLAAWTSEADSLRADLELLMERTHTDYIIACRRLSAARRVLGAEPGVSVDQLLSPLGPSFVEGLSSDDRSAWEAVVKRWSVLQLAEGRDADLVANEMDMVNPKYVPREWMLARAYRLAYNGDFSEVRKLHALFKRPYDEQQTFEEYFAPAPAAVRQSGGIHFMSCSS